MMRFGPDAGPVVVLALPLFEEANRTRVVAIATLRALAGRGIAGALPDLPGQGDSLVPTEAATLADLRSAFAGAAEAIVAEGRPVYAAAIRSGALVSSAARAQGFWRLSPQDGPSLLRESDRVRRQEVGADPAGDRGGHIPEKAPGPSISIAGNLIAPRLLHELASADLGDPAGASGRVVRLSEDPRPANHHLAGAPPWRRAEPGGDDVLAQALAGDIADWISRFAAR